jgi:hypothetical protein
MSTSPILKLAAQVVAAIQKILGRTDLIRIGRWPKKLLLYRTDMPLSEITVGQKGCQIEFLGQGQQFVAYGIHETTGKPYEWPTDTPVDTPVSDLPTPKEPASSGGAATTISGWVMASTT